MAVWEITSPANRQAMPGADTSKWVPASLDRLPDWLASDAGKEVNGAVIPVYGGELYSWRFLFWYFSNQGHCTFSDAI